MNRFKAIGSALLFAPAIALVSTQARAEFKCNAPTGFDRIACEKALESPQALRLYIQRMRLINNMYFQDYVDDARLFAWSQDQPASAAAKSAPVKTATSTPENPGA